jgi:hypothetical protein
MVLGPRFSASTAAVGGLNAMVTEGNMDGELLNN